MSKNLSLEFFSLQYIFFFFREAKENYHYHTQTFAEHNYAESEANAKVLLMVKDIDVSPTLISFLVLHITQ